MLAGLGQLIVKGDVSKGSSERLYSCCGNVVFDYKSEKMYNECRDY